MPSPRMVSEGCFWIVLWEPDVPPSIRLDDIMAARSVSHLELNDLFQPPGTFPPY